MCSHNYDFDYYDCVLKSYYCQITVMGKMTTLEKMNEMCKN